MEETWCTRWRQQREGRHLIQIKDKIEQWPIAGIADDRRSETVMARLRIGHCGLRAHLHRFGLHDTPLCECGEPETVRHVLVECCLWIRERRQTYGDNIMNNQLTIKALLGGGEESVKDKRDTVNKVLRFLTVIGKINTI